MSLSLTELASLAESGEEKVFNEYDFGATASEIHDMIGLGNVSIGVFSSVDLCWNSDKEEEFFGVVLCDKTDDTIVLITDIGYGEKHLKKCREQVDDFAVKYDLLIDTRSKNICDWRVVSDQ